jgi:hypothetical protein
MGTGNGNGYASVGISSLGSTGRPASCQATQPPTSARALGQPAARSSRATRALVASSFHAQYSTTVA